MKNSNKERLAAFLTDNIVVILFLAIAVFGISASGGGITGNFTVYFINFFGELMERVFRNSFLVLSLMIPVIAGLGLNFGIVIGAIAAQTAIIFLRYHDIGGMGGFILALLLSLPLALLFGWLTGKLYNRVRGQEMIAGMVVAFFASGLYNLFFLFIVGYVIRVDGTNPIIAPPNIEGIPVGIRMSVDMGTMTGAIDNIIRIPFMFFILLCAITMITYVVFTQIRKFNSSRQIIYAPVGAGVFMVLIVACSMLELPNIIAGILGFLGVATQKCFLFICVLRHKKQNPDYTAANKASLIFNCILASGAMLWAVYNIVNDTYLLTGLRTMAMRQAPLVTALLFAVLFVFLNYIMKTKLGQDFRAVGQSQHIAEVSGINVNRTRIIATIFSTVLAAWGMVVFLQNMGTLTTYDSHRNVGFFSVAAILVGGASTSKATLRNVITGVILFNAMTIVTPDIARIIFGDRPGAAEYLRSFMVYGVIGLALGMYVWKSAKASRDQHKLRNIKE